LFHSNTKSAQGKSPASIGSWKPREYVELIIALESDIVLCFAEFGIIASIFTSKFFNAFVQSVIVADSASFGV
jgi:hypothetical protein